ncbi:MAG TPA: chorismate mutase [Cyanobacteria bacterium UBA11049]|nr:chorismate mutase [Cyanobacteria bacterium UBA11049]
MVTVRKTKILAYVTCAWTIAFGTAAYADTADISTSIPIEQQVQEVVSHLDGAMDTSAQASANPKAANVRITTCKVKVEDAAALNRSQQFLYQEQALSQKLTQPYRQRFLRIAPSADKRSVESAVFKPPTPAAWTGLCAKPEAERIVKISDIGESKCSVFLQRQSENYVGDTKAGGCPSDYKGAVRITNHIVLHQAGMDTLDRGFNAAGIQVWGAKNDPYQFRWVNSTTRNRK